MEVKIYQTVLPELRSQLWELYRNAAADMETYTPFKQIIEKEEFHEILVDPSFLKFILWRDTNPEGIGIVATDVSKVLWLSPSYFTKRHHSRPVRYLLGLAVSPTTSQKTCLGGKMIIQTIIDSMTADTVLCYDYSQHLHYTFAALGQLMGRKNLGQGEVTDTLKFCEFWRS